jgi:hypothetical protein
VRAAHPYLLYASGVIGVLASAFDAFITFRSPWTPRFSTGTWRIWLAVRCGVSALMAIAIYTISELTHRDEPARSTQGSIEGSQVVPPLRLGGRPG